MRIVALGLVGSGAVLVDAGSGEPLPIPPNRFLDEADATAFLAWTGDPCGKVSHLRNDAREWSRVRDWVTCPACNRGRVKPGDALCEPCGSDVEFDRQLNDHLREPGRNHDAV